MSRLLFYFKLDWKFDRFTMDNIVSNENSFLKLNEQCFEILPIHKVDINSKGEKLEFQALALYNT